MGLYNKIKFVFYCYSQNYTGEFTDNSYFFILEGAG